MGIWPIGSWTRPSGWCSGPAPASCRCRTWRPWPGCRGPPSTATSCPKKTSSTRWESANAGASTRRWTKRCPESSASHDWKPRSTSSRRFVEAQPPGRLLDLEPSFAHDQMAAALPMLAEGLVVVLQRCAREGAFATAADPRDLAGAIARTALSHYIFPDATAPQRAGRSAPPPVFLAAPECRRVAPCAIHAIHRYGSN